MSFRRGISHVLNHPLGRGMISYSITWPTAAFIQDFMDKRNIDEINWKKCIRYSLYGSLFIAPTLYCWVRIAHRIFPRVTLASAIKKAALEQITYGPISLSAFFLIMTYAETGSVDKAKQELQAKFWNTYKIAVCFWPAVQTINFSIIPDRNRLVFVSFCGLLWITFLAYVKDNGDPLEKLLKNSKQKSVEPSK
ncbi:hypothetical protein HA402_002123 [Bradysia odoriphaga]|nr:hypothetical protein HA402_002123 [Bradysia odoriphaga]